MMPIRLRWDNQASMPVRRPAAGMLLLFALLLGSALPATGTPLRVATGPLGAGVTVRQSVKSSKELREQQVTIQQLDYSCGSAAVSTIFTYYLRQPVSEKEVIEHILRTGDLEKIIRRRGFSLLELKNFAESHGAIAEGYAMDFEALAGVEVPVIVPMKFTDRLHFVVYRGVRRDRVFLADPALGKRTMSAEEFDQLWSPKAGLLISKPGLDLAAAPLAIDDQDEFYLESLCLRALVLRPALHFFRVTGEF